MMIFQGAADCHSAIPQVCKNWNEAFTTHQWHQFEQTTAQQDWWRGRIQAVKDRNAETASGRVLFADLHTLLLTEGSRSPKLVQT